MISLIICDLDGLLADTETLHFESYRLVFEEFGFELTMDQYQPHWIRDGLTIREFVAKNNLPHDPQDLHNKKIELYRDLVRQKVQPMDSAIDFVKRFHKVKPMAIATNSFLYGAKVVLDTLEITEYFDIITTRDDITRHKPDPEIFLLTAERADVDPSECLVLEDAQKGIDAAHSAGMKSIAVPNIYTKENDFSKATLKLNSLSEITSEIIDSL